MPRVYEEYSDIYSDLEHALYKAIKTGLTPDQGATELLIYHWNGYTYVVTSGEFSNAEPTRTRGIVTPEDVLADYLSEL